MASQTKTTVKAVAKSKSIWFYGLSLVATIGTVLLADETFKDLVGDNMGYITGLMSVVGLALRFATDRPIGKENLDILDEHAEEYEEG